MKNWVITGVSSGIGLQTLKLLLRDKNVEEVFAISTKPNPPEEVVSSKLIWIQENYGVANAFEQAKHEIGNTPIHGLILNAGILSSKDQGGISQMDLTNTFNVNTFGPILLIQSILGSLIKGKAHIVAIGSMGGYQGASKFPGLSIYSASKSALSCYIECIAQELYEDGVRANVLALGAVNTRMLQQAFPGYQAPVSPESMAEYIVSFANNNGQIMTGKVIPLSLVNPN